MEFLKTGDGSLTVRHEVLGELYHSDRGAIGEAEHIYIQAGFDRIAESKNSGQISVFEMGFGTGLNCWLTYCRATGAKIPIRVDYRAVELYPIGEADAGRLNYTEDPAFSELHRSPWDGEVHAISDCFLLAKYRADLSAFDFGSLAGHFDVVYFDAFAPDAQPELWSEEVMRKMYSILKPGGTLVTYSSKGSVKCALRSAGFEVTRLPGALGKRHMVQAVKPLD
ncbi:MAG: tRNA (5-methylaminomethyl-2-thiouridine)(34)-methyltransferase MnmD [Rikenellaceae bacterium]|nr:tRNA (5-methylaminomethyl-2-thiouridine)(34)-methyltransferase MnmD [Rikenellaceae bacterium]